MPRQSISHGLVTFSAITLLLVTGEILVFLSVVMQVITWEARDYFVNRDVALPFMTENFLAIFGRRPDTNLAAVILWFFWPMTYLVASSYFDRSQQPCEYAITVLLLFISGWLGILLFVTLCLFFLAIPFITTLSELGHQPDIIQWIIYPIAPLSWIIPFATVAAVFRLWWKFKGGNRIVEQT